MNTVKQYSIKYLQNCIKKEDTRVHYTVLKQHSHKDSGHPQPPHTHVHTGHKNPTETTMQNRMLFQTPNNATNQADQKGLSHDRHQATQKRVDLHPDSKKGLKHPCWCENHKIKLLRKEVIQPHLPVRLPCYDFVPIADPTFDSSLTSLGHWLRVLPTFMT